MLSALIGFGKHLRHNGLEVLICQCRDGRVVNARALRARGPPGPHGFESHSRRSFALKAIFVAPNLLPLLCG